MKSLRSKIPLLIAGLVLLGLLVYAFLPEPVEVDAGSVKRGPLRITVDEDGMTRVKERYVISTPVAGRVLRVELEPGDKVKGGHTVVAVVEPGDSQLLDPRARAQAEAAVKTAAAALDRARANFERAREAHEFARVEYERAQRLIAEQLISQQAFDNAAFQSKAAGEERRAAEFEVTIAEFELEQARAVLLHASSGADPSADETRFEIRSPIDGRVFKRFQESAAVVEAGTPLLELGDPLNLEIIIDVLSTDAVRIAPGTRVLIEHWGGDAPLEARVRLVEPAAFTKISVLGVEEQRVWVVADFVAPPEDRLSLGDAYRVEARIVVWESDDVLKVPASALFRGGENWMVFVIQDGRATERRVGIGHNNGLEAEVLDGLNEGDRVVLYPSDQVEDGVAVDVE